MLLRCPECLCEIQTADDASPDLRCGNCGEVFSRAEAMVSLADAEDYASEIASCTCDSVRGCPQCFQRADELVGAIVRDSGDREWEVTDVDEKGGFPLVVGDANWSYLDEITVVRAAEVRDGD